MTNLEVLKMELNTIVKKDSLVDTDWVRADKILKVIEEIENGDIPVCEVGDDDILECEDVYLTAIDSDEYFKN